MQSRPNRTLRPSNTPGRTAARRGVAAHGAASTGFKSGRGLHRAAGREERGGGAGTFEDASKTGRCCRSRTRSTKLFSQNDPAPAPQYPPYTRRGHHWRVFLSQCRRPRGAWDSATPTSVQTWLPRAPRPCQAGALPGRGPLPARRWCNPLSVCSTVGSASEGSRSDLAAGVLVRVGAGGLVRAGPVCECQTAPPS